MLNILFEDLACFGNVCKIFHNVGVEWEEMQNDKISEYNSLHLMSLSKAGVICVVQGVLDFGCMCGKN